MELITENISNRWDHEIIDDFEKNGPYFMAFALSFILYLLVRRIIKINGVTFLGIFIALVAVLSVTIEVIVYFSKNVLPFFLRTASTYTWIVAQPF